MKIYFCGSIGGGRQDAHLYGRLIKKLGCYGTVLTTHVGDLKVIENEKDMTDKEIHDRDVSWLIDSDVLVAEVTQTSMGVGYEIGRGIGLGKPALCLFRPDSGKEVSAMVGGCGDASKSIVFKKYKEEEVDEIFKEFFKSLK